LPQRYERQMQQTMRRQTLDRAFPEQQQRHGDRQQGRGVRQEMREAREYHEQMNRVRRDAYQQASRDYQSFSNDIAQQTKETLSTHESAYKEKIGHVEQYAQKASKQHKKASKQGQLSVKDLEGAFTSAMEKMTNVGMESIRATAREFNVSLDTMSDRLRAVDLQLMETSEQFGRLFTRSERMDIQYEVMQLGARSQEQVEQLSQTLMRLRSLYPEMGLAQEEWLASMALVEDQAVPAVESVLESMTAAAEKGMFFTDERVFESLRRQSERVMRQAHMGVADLEEGLQDVVATTAALEDQFVGFGDTAGTIMEDFHRVSQEPITELTKDTELLMRMTQLYGHDLKSLFVGLEEGHISQAEAMEMSIDQLGNALEQMQEADPILSRELPALFGLPQEVLRLDIDDLDPEEFAQQVEMMVDPSKDLIDFMEESGYVASFEHLVRTGDHTEALVLAQHETKTWIESVFGELSSIKGITQRISASNMLQNKQLGGIQTTMAAQTGAGMAAQTGAGAKGFLKGAGRVAPWLVGAIGVQQAIAGYTGAGEDEIAGVEAAREGLPWGTALAGGKLGAKGGAALGTAIAPGLGTLIGGAIGGLGGGLAGFFGGEALIDPAADWVGRLMGGEAYQEEVPAYQHGTPYVPEDQFAFLHRGEAVLSPDEAERYRNVDDDGREQVHRLLIREMRIQRLRVERMDLPRDDMAGPGTYGLRARQTEGIPGFFSNVWDSISGFFSNIFGLGGMRGDGRASGVGMYKGAQEWVDRFPLTSPFGSRTITVDGQTYNDFHNGIDLGMPEGTPIPALGGGVVSDAGRDSTRGKYLYQKLPSGKELAYYHLSSIAARAGQAVRPGQKIAASGNTGRSTGPHLHLGVRASSGEWIDPESWLQSGDMAAGANLGPVPTAVYNATPTIQYNEGDRDFDTTPIVNALNSNSMQIIDLLRAILYKLGDGDRERIRRALEWDEDELRAAGY